jgi:hypothetical protein
MPIARRIVRTTLLVVNVLILLAAAGAVMIGGAPSDPAYPGQPADHGRLVGVPIGLVAGVLAGLSLGQQRRPWLAAVLTACACAAVSLAYAILG